METLALWHAMVCKCSFHIARDTVTGVIRYVTREEAQVIHQQLYNANPERILNPITSPQPAPILDDAHGFLGHTQARYDAVWYESKRLDKALDVYRSLANKPEAETAELKWGYQADLVVDATQKGSRLLIVRPPVSVKLKTDLSAALALEFGAGQVKVE